MHLTRFFGRYPSNHVSAISQGFLHMKSTLESKSFISLIVAPALQRSHRLPSETLAYNLCIFMNEEVLDGICITLASRRLGERPGSG